MMPMTDVQMERLEWSVMGLEGLGGLMIVGVAERENFRLAFRDERVSVRVKVVYHWLRLG